MATYRPPPKSDMRMKDVPRAWYLEWLAYCDHEEIDRGMAQKDQMFSVQLTHGGVPDRRFHPWYGSARGTERR